jgi:dTDP-4-amino-4,6-dideoxygalactose transaminase
MPKVPFNRPTLVGNELRYIAEAIQNDHISGDGPFTKSCQSFLEGALGVPRALLTTNCTHALEMTAFLLDVKPGDEVIMPSFTFVSTANAFVLRGAKPVFIDIRPDTLNIDESRIEAAITDRTRAIVVVHYAGVGCEMDAILEIAQRRGIPVVEDNAHGLFASYKGRPLGTFGVLATQSFHETKNFTCGEGGALLINDDAYVEQAEILREKGTNRARFFRGQIDKYTWVSQGSSYGPADILAAFLLAQFEQREMIKSTRRKQWEHYYAQLAPVAKAGAFALPHIPAYCEQAYHMFYLLLPSLDERQALIAHLKDHEINAVFHYVPLHTSDFALEIGANSVDCRVTESVSDRLVRLPFHNALTPPEQDRVADAIGAFYGVRA